MRKIILLIALVTFSCGLAFGQSKGITPMHLFFQKNADSTIIIEYATDSYDPHYYKIITRTGDTINTFQYYAIQRAESGIVIPKKLRFLIDIEKVKYFSAAADINPYFSLVNLPADTLRTIWEKINSGQLWVLDEKLNNVNKCNQQVPVTSHMGYGIMHLITKGQIRTLIFNAPEYYEKYCPGNKNRQAFLKLEGLLNRYFPNNK